jgi:hypothetical protein
MHPPTPPADARASRRQFVGGTVLAGGAAAAAAAEPDRAAGVERAARPAEIEADVLVCGGGCAGTAAALAAARGGARTLLVEKAPFAGGIVTSVGLPYFDGIADTKDHRVVVRGIALELLAKSGVCGPDAKTMLKHNPTIPNTFSFKVLLDREFAACGDRLTVLYNSFVAAAERTAGRITAVTIANKDGLVRVRPRTVIDCTGDADVAAWAGVETVQNPELMPLTLHFRIGNVRKEPGLSAACRDALVRARQRGELPHFYGPGVMFLFAADEVYVHGVRVPANPLDAADLSRAEVQGRADALAMFQAWNRDVPAFADAYFIEAYPWIGVRESRRLVGRHVLSEDDIRAGRRFDDAIATGCWYFDVHPNKTTLGGANDFAPEKHQPDPYDIPFASLVPVAVDNLLVAGRCHSATRGAQSSTRVTVTAMAMGEAAGTAAALASAAGTDVGRLDGREVRGALAKRGAGPFTTA